MVMICCLPQFVQASSDLFDQDDRTNVIRCVIDIENQKMEIDKLWDLYFYNQTIEVSSVLVNGQYMKVYNSFSLRKPYTTDENVTQYQKNKNEYDLFIEDAIENIKFMVSNGADLSTKDEFGKTVMDYCSVQEVYNVLRDLGAPISLKVWFYFNENEAILISSVAVVTIAFGLGVTAGFIRAIYQ